MYTKNTNSKTNVVTVTLSCNTKGCKQHTTGKNNREAWQASRKLGWLTPNANEALCATHRKEYTVREGKLVLKSVVKAERDAARAVKKAEKAEAKGKSPSKSTVAQTKAEKVTKAVETKKSPRKVTSPKALASASVGQSIGKLAKSAKK